MMAAAGEPRWSSLCTCPEIRASHALVKGLHVSKSGPRCPGWIQPLESDTCLLCDLEEPTSSDHGFPQEYDVIPTSSGQMLIKQILESWHQ